MALRPLYPSIKNQSFPCPAHRAARVFIEADPVFLQVIVVSEEVRPERTIERESMKTSRRHFIAAVAGLTSSLLLDVPASADTPTIAESDPTAQALGYKADASKVDKAKYANYSAGQSCANCQFYQGAAASASGPCPLLGGKSVEAKGWCSGYAKKG